MQCEVWSVKEAVGSEKCEVWSVKCGVWSLSLECEERSVKCEVWGLECEGSSEKWEVWSVKCEVWSVSLKFGVRRVQCAVWGVECRGKDTVGTGCLWTIGHLFLETSAAGLPGSMFYIYIYIFIDPVCWNVGMFLLSCWQFPTQQSQGKHCRRRLYCRCSKQAVTSTFKADQKVLCTSLPKLRISDQLGLPRW